MTPHFRRARLAGGLAACLLAGCSLTPKTIRQCGTCVPPVAASVPSTYENYTPPPSVLKPLPESQDAAPPPPPEASFRVPSSSESALTIPDGKYDFFESSRERRQN